MKKNRFYALVVVTLLILSGSLCRAQDEIVDPHDQLQKLAVNDTYPTFSLTLTAQKPEFRVGDYISIRMTMTNLTNHDIEANRLHSAVDTLYEYEVLNEDGKSLDPIPGYNTSMMGFVIFDQLSAGKSGHSSTLLERVFKLDQPGKYTIRVSRPEPFVKDEKGEHPVIWSNPITIQIFG
jgi:hypothetical protein